MRVEVTDCARCGETHEIKFKKFSRNPIESGGKVLSHWGMCSNVNEPVLLRIEETPITQTKTSDEVMIKAVP